MITRSAKSKETGQITVCCYDYNGALFATGKFADLQDADNFGASAERNMMIAMQSPFYAPTNFSETMTLDEIFSELDA